ncbi:MAG: twitching motility protein PilT [Bacteroidetes bacterium 4484_276]|nr:MAG: twitching motility protein PilT [Bacteroidetes bacterium 4484_276]
MNNLFIDTNIVIDLLAKRHPFFANAAQLFSLADKRIVDLSISALTFANTHYTLSKSKKSDDAKSILRKLKLIVTVLPLDDKIIGLALNDRSFKDFEDGLQYFTAIENNQDIIITRNLKDFKKTKLPVMTAEQFLISRYGV